MAKNGGHVKPGSTVVLKYQNEGWHHTVFILFTFFVLSKEVSPLTSGDLVTIDPKNRHTVATLMSLSYIYFNPLSAKHDCSRRQFFSIFPNLKKKK